MPTIPSRPMMPTSTVRVIVRGVDHGDHGFFGKVDRVDFLIRPINDLAAFQFYVLELGQKALVFGGEEGGEDAVYDRNVGGRRSSLSAGRRMRHSHWLGLPLSSFEVGLLAVMEYHSRGSQGPQGKGDERTIRSCRGAGFNAVTKPRLERYSRPISTRTMRMINNTPKKPLG